MIDGKSVLIIGGTGSFGGAFVSRILKDYPGIERLVIYSRDELKQHLMAQEYSDAQYPFIRYFLGDVRDRERLTRAMEGIDIVIHAAALKHVPAAEYNPFEFIKTNVLGAQNVIDGCLDTKVSQVIVLSTDKAAAPINLYGATKLCSDKLFIAANNIKGTRDLKFSIVRYGNVFGSRGSVVPFFLEKKKTGTLPITDPQMTRFSISLQEAVNMVLWSLENSQGGEIFIPKIPSYRIVDLANAIDPNCKQEIVGIRPGEKIHEEMVTASDSFHTLDLGDYFAILPSTNRRNLDECCKLYNAEKVTPGFAYNSGTNSSFLTIEELGKLIENVEAQTGCGNR